MRLYVVSITLLALLVSCSSGGRRDNESGMAAGGAGGLSTRDTIPTSTAPTSATADSVNPTKPTTNPTSTPAGVLSQLNVANTTEIQLASLAAKKANSPKVKQIATKLAADHSKNREQLQALAQKLNLSLTPAEGGSVSAADSSAMPSDLQAKSGPDFDRAFVSHEVQDHQANIEKLQSQAIPSVQNPEVKAFLQKTVTDMRAHLSSLQQIQKQLGH
jgi:putative membrane protein